MVFYMRVKHFSKPAIRKNTRSESPHKRDYYDTPNLHVPFVGATVVKFPVMFVGTITVVDSMFYLTPCRSFVSVHFIITQKFSAP